MSADGQEAGRGPDLGRKAGALDVDGPALVVLARAAIAQSLGLAHEPVDPHGAGLRQPGACFVTLRRDGRLRGCIGSLEAYRPLGEDVAANARAAAFHDPRFPALHPQELAGTQVEVSVLSTPEPFPVASRADALARMRPGARRRGGGLGGAPRHLPAAGVGSATGARGFPGSPATEGGPVRRLLGP